VRGAVAGVAHAWVVVAAAVAVAAVAAVAGVAALLLMLWSPMLMWLLVLQVSLLRSLLFVVVCAGVGV